MLRALRYEGKSVCLFAGDVLSEKYRWDSGVLVNNNVVRMLIINSTRSINRRVY